MNASMELPVWLHFAISLLPPPASSPATASAPAESILSRMRREAKAVAPLVKTTWVKGFLHAVGALPAVAPRTLQVDIAKRRYYTRAAADRLPKEQRDLLVTRTLDDTVYYTTKYGTPLAYARPLDLLGQNGMRDASGMRIIDFGYGTIGHLRLLASLGADVTGIDVDTMLTALYSQPGDTGVIKGLLGRDGRIRLVEGRFPTDETVRTQVGDGFDLFISKNTLKMGYVHPTEKVDPRTQLNIGVDDETFVRAVFSILNPGGRAMIYNICPAFAPPGKPFIPWSDGRCPFDRAVIERVGFNVIAFDIDDSGPCRAMAHALEWDKGEGGMDLEHDLFAHYTLLQKPAG